MRNIRVAFLSMLVIGLLMNLPAMNHVSAAAAPQTGAEVNSIAATENNQLIGFDITKPEEILSTVDITGLQEGEKINSLMIGPDAVLNPPPGPTVLLAVTNQGRFYTINTETGQALRFGNLQLFIGEDFDAVLLPASPAAASNGLFTKTDSTKVLAATEEEAIEVDMDKSEVCSGLFVYGEGDENFGKQPCIVDIQTINVVDDQDDGSETLFSPTVFGFDKNQCVIVEILRVDKVTGIAEIQTLEDISSKYEDGTLTSKEGSKYYDYIPFATVSSGPPSTLKSYVSEPLDFGGLGPFGGKRPNKLDSIKNEDENIEKLMVILGDKVGTIGSITTDSPIRAVTTTRVVPPDYVLATDERTITLKRGEKIKLDINILRLEGFTGNITVNRPDALPNKVKIKPASASTTGDSVKFKKIKIKGSAQPGTYPLEFTATDETGRVRKVTVNLVIE
ncbi:MAG: DUF4394 domain-containing protein [Blastocatellia bacterium]|nr:DUF4394 domain-containing protein [Blastocatellia bacterium]